MSRPRLTRRELVRLMACAPAVGALAGCARRIDPSRAVEGTQPVDGNVIVTPAQAPELAKVGGAVVVHPRGTTRALLVVNAGHDRFISLGAICPHEQCELAWVPEDRQAECPCHGSRFASDGKVLHPPAQADVPTYPVKLDAEGNFVIHLYAGDGRFPPVQDGRCVFFLRDHPELESVGGAVEGQPDGFPVPLVVVRSAADAVLALDSTCTHQRCKVGLEARQLRCPCHGSTFDKGGGVTRGPASSALRRFPTELSAGIVTIRTS